jgi:hypothetical protein
VLTSELSKIENVHLTACIYVMYLFILVGHRFDISGLGYYESKHQEPWFDEECLDLLHQRKQAKLQWLQTSRQTNGDDLNNLRCECNRTLRNKMREYLREKINELQTGSKNKNIRDLYRGIIEIKEGYQPRTNRVKDENGDLLAYCSNIANRGKNYFFQLLDVYVINDIRQTVMHTAEPLVPELLES